MEFLDFIWLKIHFDIDVFLFEKNPENKLSFYVLDSLSWPKPAMGCNARQAEPEPEPEQSDREKEGRNFEQSVSYLL